MPKTIVKIKDLKEGDVIEVDDGLLVFKKIERDQSEKGIYVQALKYLYFDSLDEDIIRDYSPAYKINKKRKH